MDIHTEADYTFVRFFILSLGRQNVQGIGINLPQSECVQQFSSKKWILLEGEGITSEREREQKPPNEGLPPQRASSRRGADGTALASLPGL